MKVLATVLAMFLVGCGVGTVGPKGDTGDNGKDGKDGKDSTTQTSKNCTVIPDTRLGFVTKDEWKVANWYDTTKSPAEPVEFSYDGIFFTNPTINSHTTVMKDTGDFDVTGCEHLYLKFAGQVSSQTLPGTGMDDREAPLGLTVKYTDAKGVLHASLNAYNEGEPDDRATTRMFWKGFSSKNTGYVNDNTVKVGQYEYFVQKYDLMELSPKPTKIHFVAISSAGWGPDRSALAQEISLGDDCCCK